MRKGKRVDNTDSEELVTDSSPYLPDPFPSGHRFFGLLRVPRTINGKKVKEDDDALKANRARVKQMFLDDLRPRVLSNEVTEKTAVDSATLATSMWQYLGIDLWQQSPIGSWFWEYPEPKFTNSVLKALNQVLGAHRHEEDKFNGIINKLWERYSELNAGIAGQDVVYLTSGDIYRLFGIKTKKQKEVALALQAEADAVEGALTYNERMIPVHESMLLSMHAAFNSQRTLFGGYAEYIENLLNAAGDE